MDDRKPPSQAKDCEVPADGVASLEERGGVEGDPLKPPEGAPTAQEPEAKEPPQACSALPRRCALCNCGEWRLHGQGKLQRFEPAPDWTERLSGLPAGRGPGESLAPGDDLSLIGFAEGVSPGELFEPTGHCWAHHWCAAWSAGVQRQAGAGLSDVDKAVFSGISQKCEHCQRMGATIQCHSEGCLRHYHFPCAAASGSFQSMKTLWLLCPEHVTEAVQMEDSRCMVCDGPGDLRDLLFCTSCGLHYHGTCLDVPVTPRKRSGWQCPECKVCQTCRQPGADSMMLVCEACDKGYHTFCLKPAIESLPTDSWKCKNCRVCSDCGSRPAALDPGCHWYENYSVCEGCQRHRNAAGGTDAARRCQSCQKPLPPDGSDMAGGSTCLACQGQQKHPQPDGAVPQEEMPAECEAKPLGPAPEAEELEEEPGPAAPAKDEATEPIPPETAPEPPAPPPAPPDPPVATSPACPEERPPDAKEEPAPEQPAGPPAITAALLEPAGSPQPPMEKAPAAASPPRTETPPAAPLPGSPAPQLGPPQPREAMECGEEEGMDTAGGEAGSLASPAEDGAQPTPAVALGPFPGLAGEEEEETAAGLEQAGAGGRGSPPLSEDGLEESRGRGDPESSQTPVSFTSEPKGSPMLLEPEELGPATPMEVYGTGGKLLERGDEVGPEPPILRPRPTLIKSDIVNEISNLSQGDTRSSFPGSEPLLGSPDPEGGGSLSMELGMTSTDSLQKDDAGSLPHCTDSLAETDDSLLFEPGAGAKGEGEKGRRRSSPGRSRVKQGRSSSFPGRRRPRGGTQGGRGRGRARLKSTTSSIETLALADIDSSPSKEDDEEEDDTMQNTVVLFSNTDKFVLMQDMCVVCGSFGRGAEGHLLACSQCSQCYHPYCVNSKITKVMLLKGWRCVECIVCEVCGKASDPSRLLLCDDCDISYHTYCLDPPLHTVPKGGWKCKWCVCCVQCGAGSPGFHCEWQNNYTHCAPCASLVTCPVCRVKYVEDDLLIQCRHCDRWLHAVCNNLFTEEEVEQAADEGFDCSSCQPYVVKPVVPVAPPEIIPVKIKEPEPQYFRFEGVWLTETGMAVLRNLSMSPLHKRRQRKTRLGTLNGEGGLEGGDPLGTDEKKDGDLDGDDLLKGEVGVEHMECEIKLEAAASPDRDGGADVDSGKGLEDSEECKKRKRKPYRPGIGGFMVRQRKSHTRLKKGSAALVEACREVLSAEGHPEDGAPAEIPAEGATEQGATEGDEKKKRRGRKKSKLEDMFPAYLQEAFFGKALMDLSRKALLAAGGVGDGAACPPFGQGAPRPRVDPGVPGTLQRVPGDGKETPAHLKGDDSMDSSALVAQEEDPKGAEAKAEDPGAEEPKGSPDPGDSEKPATPGEGALSSDLDKIPTEELPKMESKDIQQLFKDVLGSAEREQQLNCVAAGMEAGMGGRDPNRAQLSQRPFLQGSVSLGSLSSAVPMESYSGVCQSPFLDNRERSGFFSPDHCEPESPWASSSAATTPSTPTTPTTEGEGDGLSYNQRSLQRWEKDEELGELSTISPVLYANMNFPSLKQDYPDWSSRCKQIMKLWRKVPAPDKAPYLQKAKDNRAAHRINKVQKQAESQINKQTKGEVLRKPERPSLHLRIPPQPGALPGAAGQPVYINSPVALPGSADGFLKSPAGAEAAAESSEVFLKLPSQSPAQVPSHDPYSYPLEPRFPSPLGQSPTAGAAFQPFPTQQQQLLPTPRPALGPQPPEFHPTSPGTPRHQPSTPDPFLKPRCLSGSLDNLSVPGSPGARPPEPLLSPPPFGEQKRSLEAGGLQVKKEEGGPGVCSPGYMAAMGYADSPSHLSSAELKAADVFKAPLTPRVSQVEPQSPGLAHPHPQALAPSPPSHPDLYRQSPSVSCYSDPYAQPPLTPRPQPPDSCCALPPRSLPSDPFSRVPASPQSQSSSQSPLTPRPLSNEACCQSPVTPRFQSPDPYSRPPSRPQSRDPFAPLHKPPRPQMPDSGFKSIPISHNPPAGGGFPPAQPSDPHSKGPGSQQPPFARSPGASVFAGTQAQMRFTFPSAVSEPLKGSPSHQPHGMNSHFASSQPMGKPQSANYASSPGFHQAGSPLGPGNCPAETYSLSPLRPPSVLPQQPPHPQQQQDGSLTYLPRAGMAPPADKRDEVVSGISALPSRELPELPVSQEGAVSSISQSELEKQRQRQRLRELLIRQQIQRNNLRQEKESAAAATSSSPAAWSAEASSQAFEQLRGLAPYQPAQDKSALGNLPAAPGSSKLSGPAMVPAAFAPDERLSRPPPAATPSAMDLNGRPSVGAPQTFFPRGMFQGPSPQQQQMWQQQQAAAVRLPGPARFQQPPGHELSRPALGGLAGRMTGPAEQIPSSPGAVGAQFIELRHNAQKGAAGGMGSPFAQQGPPARPRFFLPGDESSSQALRASVMPLPAPVLQPQKLPAPLPPSATSPQGAERSHQPPPKSGPPVPPPPSGLELQHGPPRPLSSSGSGLRPDGPKDSPAMEPPLAPVPAPVPSKSHLALEGGRLPCEVPVEPDLDDDFDSHKDLEDDDLANLSLDPDVAKGDDDLGNLDNLETNDPHLDDLLNGDEFDLLAYTDPELDTGDKKDIFNEHLRLVESANEKAEREALLKREPAGPCPKGPGEPKELAPPREGLPPTPCPSSTAPAPHPTFKAQASILEAKPASLPSSIQPKLEEGCLKTSPCQFNTGASDRLPVPVKSEALQGAEKMAASLGLTLKSGQNLLSAGAGPVRLGTAPFPNNGQAATSGSDKGPYAAPGRGLAPGQSPALLELGGGALGLANAQHSQADDLEKMESSLVASELPLLIEDLLEHEKKELQKKQQMSAHLPGGAQHLQTVQQQHSVLAHPAGPAQPPDGQAPRLVGPQQQLQLGLIARQQNLVPTQQLMTQQQRVVGPQQGQVLAPHMAMAQPQPHVLAAQHGVQPALTPQPNQQLVQKIPGVQPTPMGMKPQQLVMQQQQQQLANSFFPDTDLDKFAAEDIMDPIAKAKMVALKGIKKVMAQGSIGVAPGMNRQQVSLLAQRLSGATAAAEMQNHVPAGSGQERSGSDPSQTRPNPPTFAQGIINEADQRQYEEWLFHTQQLLQMQLKVLEEQIGVHRKSRKALCAKQRTAKKAGREFPEADAEKLKLVTEQQSKIQKQLDQVSQQQQSMLGQVSQQQQSMLGQVSQPPAPQQGSGGQPMVPKQQGILVQPLSPQPGMMGHSQVSMLQHQGVAGHQTPPRQVLLAPHQQRVLGSPQLVQQTHGLMGHRLILSPAQQQQAGLLGQSRTLLTQQQQQSSLAQHPALLGQGQGQAAQPGLLGQGQGQGQAAQQQIQHFPQHGALGQSPSMLHLSQGAQPAPQGTAAKEQQGGAESAVLPPEGAEGRGQHPVQLSAAVGGPGSQDLGGQPHMGPQEQPGIQNLNPLALPSQEQLVPPGGEQQPQKHQPEPGQQQQPRSLPSPQQTMASSLQRMQGGLQQGNLLHPPLQNSAGLAQLGGTMRPEQPHSDPAQGPRLLAPPSSGAEPQQQPGSMTSQGQSIMVQLPPPQRIVGQPPAQSVDQQAKGLAGQRLPSPAGQHKAGLVGQPQQSMLVPQVSHAQSILSQVSAPVMGQIRAQLQGVISKNPQLRHLTPQQQQQLQAFLVQRHQQTLLHQSQALRQASPFPGQAQASVEQGPPPPSALQASMVRQQPRQPGTVFQVRPAGPSVAAEQMQPGFVMEQASAGQQRVPLSAPQQPLAELVHTALAGRSPQQGVLRLSAPPAAAPVQPPMSMVSLGSVQQHPRPSREQSPQEPKEASPPTLVRPPSVAQSPGAQPEHRLTPTQNSLLAEPVPTVPKLPPSQTGEESFARTPGHWEPAAQGPHSSPSMEPTDGSRKPPAGSQVNGQGVERPGPQASPLPAQAPGVCIKQEPKEETAQCVLGGGQAVKREANGDPAPAPANNLLMGSQLLAGARSEAGHLLLQKLLRAKNVQLASQRSAEGLRAEVNGHSEGKLSGLEQRLQAAPPGREDPSASKKPPAPKPKRAQKSGERVAASRKKLRKEDGLKSSEALMKQLKQEFSLLPLVEPTITANFSLFAPFGSSPINGKNQLKGAFGSAVLDSVPDYYTQLLTKNNLSNPPTPPSSLPPTPPPSVQQKMVNGVTSSEELAEQPKEPDQAREAEGRKDAPAVEVKSLDLLAALPTPPHNQTEDVRMESDEESDSPDSIVPASSPESVLGEEPPRFPLLAEVKPELPERVLSPVIPIIPRASIPVFPDPRPPEEHGGKVALAQGVAWEKGKGSEVSVMLTVSATAAKNLNGVMVAVAELLRVKIPSSYEVLFPESPVRGSGPEAKKVETDGAGGLGGKARAALAGKAPDAGTEWLKQFDAMLPGYSLKNELDILTLLKQESPGLEKAVQHCYVNNVSNLDVRQLSILTQEPSPPLSPLVPSPASPADGDRIPEAPPEVAPAPPSPPALSPPSKEEAARSPPKLKQRSRPPEEGEEPRPRLKKWKGVRWKRLRFLITIQKGGAKQDGEKEISEFIEKLGTTLRPEKVPRDLRKCCFCHEEGDGATDGPARLLNLDLDLWVHLNCALWSSEVYETQGGALINVEGALHRGLLTKCSLCQKTGATNSCNRIRCPSVYHFACAIRAKCMFFKDKTMLCPLHKLKGPCDQELSTFTVFRRVYIERDEVKQIASIIQRGERLHMFRVGGLLFHAIGQLLPHQMGDFHSVTALYPVGFEATRIYWSLRTNNRRCCYRCTICENNGRPEFVVQVIEQGLEDLVFTDSSPQAVWNRIIEPVAAMRKEADMLRLFPEYLKGEELFGLTVHAVLRIAESLPGVESCQNYLFRYGRHPLMELPLMINPTGCARSEPKILTHYKRPHTLNSTSMSKAYQSTFTGETNTPYSKQFVHSKSSQYRRLKTEWKNNVYLARSRIQGLGLYAAKDLEKHTMVIEYIGTIIRNEVANRREKIYEEQNRGIYMFRINNEHVIDATLTGGPARYINHSCAPNCVAEVVTFDKEDKIIIISSRRIPKGEELTYDYQFDFEDDQHKIPCHCGAWNCRKWMN
ncbi:histone-lysine N-methyltransferase 2D [Trachemys scripta elegans]|uniref:histone-lysine N-methyltransferase 2D n=1 Tax=Trachemys scripta elegans TaxID=31138 RepID=UPI001552609F|nr:histone-lysine N-methyltransferase 2D [Trachemys scripta elegans]